LLFEVRKTKNNCLPLARLWAHDLLRAHRNWRRTDASALKMTLRGMRAMTVMFIRPHPVSLVSHYDAGGNIFPMNLMGELGGGYFAFALVDSREAAIGVESARRIAMSSVPFPQASLVFQLAPNHFRESVDLEQIALRDKELGELQHSRSGFHVAGKGTGDCARAQTRKPQFLRCEDHA
jgi:hypothetical protein